jgi:hypothetical protein
MLEVYVRSEMRTCAVHEPKKQILKSTVPFLFLMAEMVQWYRSVNRCCVVTE